MKMFRLLKLLFFLFFINSTFAGDNSGLQDGLIDICDCPEILELSSDIRDILALAFEQDDQDETPIEFDHMALLLEVQSLTSSRRCRLYQDRYTDSDTLFIDDLLDDSSGGLFGGFAHAMTLISPEQLGGFSPEFMRFLSETSRSFFLRGEVNGQEYFFVLSTNSDGEVEVGIVPVEEHDRESPTVEVRVDIPIELFEYEDPENPPVFLRGLSFGDQEVDNFHDCHSPEVSGRMRVFCERFINSGQRISLEELENYAFVSDDENLLRQIEAMRESQERYGSGTAPEGLYVMTGPNGVTLRRLLTDEDDDHGPEVEFGLGFQLMGFDLEDPEMNAPQNFQRISLEGGLRFLTPVGDDTEAEIEGRASHSLSYDFLGREVHETDVSLRGRITHRDFTLGTEYEASLSDGTLARDRLSFQLDNTGSDSMDHQTILMRHRTNSPFLSFGGDGMRYEPSHARGSSDLSCSHARQSLDQCREHGACEIFDRDDNCIRVGTSCIIEQQALDDCFSSLRIPRFTLGGRIDPQSGEFEGADFSTTVWRPSGRLLSFEGEYNPRMQTGRYRFGVSRDGGPDRDDLEEGLEETFTGELETSPDGRVLTFSGRRRAQEELTLPDGEDVERTRTLTPHITLSDHVFRRSEIGFAFERQDETGPDRDRTTQRERRVLQFSLDDQGGVLIAGGRVVEADFFEEIDGREVAWGGVRRYWMGSIDTRNDQLDLRLELGREETGPLGDQRGFQAMVRAIASEDGYAGEMGLTAILASGEGDDRSTTRCGVSVAVERGAFLGPGSPLMLGGMGRSYECHLRVTQAYDGTISGDISIGYGYESSSGDRFTAEVGYSTRTREPRLRIGAYRRLCGGRTCSN